MAEPMQDTTDDNNVRSVVASPLERGCVCPAGSTSYRLPPGTDPSIRVGNPHYGRRMQLYCRTGFNLVIREVEGVDEDMNQFAVLEFTSAGFGGLVRIRGVNSSLYLAMNKKGRLFGEPNPREDETVFIEGVLGQYNTYMSHKYQKAKWYVGIKKTGKQKPGYKTKWGQKAIQFLPRRMP
ncbi:fibroblast growth factor 9-like isoform X2 [Macrosteles quadrilineatus]|uniref:fibroblast growth factor 9-like isoform X2 n=1 Tax=Macrosteles quadrilineatus TaxID=74068 RepID=UPI0023E220AE|nr:fibroblast growth factor 9-like isoform X2 [Macrosteles quadrilineatus]